MKEHIFLLFFALFSVFFSCDVSTSSVLTQNTVQEFSLPQWPSSNDYPELLGYTIVVNDADGQKELSLTSKETHFSISITKGYPYSVLAYPTTKIDVGKSHFFYPAGASYFSENQNQVIPLEFENAIVSDLIKTAYSSSSLSRIDTAIFLSYFNWKKLEQVISEKNDFHSCNIDKSKFIECLFKKDFSTYSIVSLESKKVESELLLNVIKSNFNSIIQDELDLFNGENELLSPYVLENETTITVQTENMNRFLYLRKYIITLKTNKTSNETLTDKDFSLAISVLPL